MKYIVYIFILFSVGLIRIWAGQPKEESSGTGFRMESNQVAASYGVDAKIIALNYQNKASGAYTPAEPVIVQFMNNGSEPIISIDLYFQVNGLKEIVETYVPEVPVQAGENVEYVFRQKADLGLFGTSIELRAGLRMPGDEDSGNNEIKVTLNNIAAGVPYVPVFIYKEGGVTVINSAGWTHPQRSGNAYWDIYSQEWFVDHSESTGNADCLLISVPLWMVEGKTYDLKFDAFTEGMISSEAQKNKMSVYVTKDVKAESGMNLLWENNAIDNSGAKYSFVRFKPSENGMYYFVFYCKSPNTANILRLQNMYVREAFRIDAGAVAVTSPQDDVYLYTNQEKVSVLVHNFGLNPVTSGQVKLNLSIDGKNLVTETIPADIGANGSVSYTFKTPVDLSEVGTVHRLSAWTTLAADQDLSNDTVVCNLESTVAGVPYFPDFGDTRNMSREVDRWSVEDKNQDDYLFVPISDVELNTFIFAHGGWRVGASTIVVPRSDDELFSRPVRLEAGLQYKLAYLSKIENAGFSIPLTVSLYKVVDHQRVFVREIWSGQVTSTSYRETNHVIDIDAAGIYELGFRVRYSEPLSFRIKLGKFRLTRVYDVNLTLEDILIPTASISCYNTYPVGVAVRNNGRNPISSFTLKAASSGTGPVEKIFTGLSLAPGDTYSAYFDNDLAFNGTESEYFKLSVSAKDDGYEPDNRDSVLISYCEPTQVPSMGNLVFFRPEGWTSINNNRDAYGFTFTQGQGFIYNTQGGEVEANDLLVSNCYALEKGKIYALEYNFGVNKGDTASFNTYLLNGKEQIPVVKVTDIPGAVGAKKTFKGYIAVPENGNYPVCMQLTGGSRSLLFNGKFNLTEASGKPDIQLLDLTVPSKDTVFSKNETVKATFRCAGQSLAYIPFTCKVGGKVYYSKYMNSVFAGDNEYTVEFSGVDLYTPGDYNVEISADVSQDATPEDNLLEKTIKSLPIPDVAIVSLDSPESGVLSKDEKVTVSIRNEGKGVLNAIPVKCTVTAGESGQKKELTGVVPGPVADGETVQYQFEEGVDLYQEGRYQFVVTAELAGDIHEENNRKEVYVLSSQKELDAGVAAILSPSDNVLTEAETVSVQVKNYSQVDLYEVPVIAEVTYLEDEASVPQTVSGKVGTIPAGETVDYVFNNTVNMKALGKYGINAYTAVKNDANPQNDACRTEVKAFKIDVGVSEIVSPESGEELGMCEVVIRVKNYGEATVGRIPVAYKVGTMPQLGEITESIAPGESCTYTFPVYYDFTAYKSYTITAYTELDVDVNADNNACSKEVENRRSDIVSIDRERISLYPNPNRGSFVISSGEAMLRSVLICNMEGILILSYDGLNQTSCVFDTMLAAGSYLVKAVTSTGVLNIKLIVRK